MNRDERKSGKIVKSCLLVLSLLTWTFISYCYGLRPDGCAAITLWPVWVWLLPGAVLALGGLPRRCLVLVVLLMWLATVMAFSEEPWSMLRSLQRPDSQLESARRGGMGLRVVTLNCAGGSIQAASEVAAHDPDIVLLQESPAGKEVESLGRKMFGEKAGVLTGVDASIIVKGRLEPITLDPKIGGIASICRVHLTSGIDLYVVSTRLIPPVLRIDLWSPECWKVEKTNRLERREQVRQLWKEISGLPSDAPIVVGGDMNAPAGDGALSIFRQRLRDCFAQGGRGWGDTVLNDIPVSRFDQIWASRQFRAIAVTACKTQYSDHRMAIADLESKR